MVKIYKRQRIQLNLPRAFADCYGRLSFVFSKSGCFDVWGGERLVDERMDGCETVKGGFFASFHMETLVFR